MTTPRTRFMRPSDWTPTPIPPRRYCNPTPLTGYRRADGTGGNPLHPAIPPDDFESRLADEMRRVRSRFPALELARYHVQMPYWSPEDDRLPVAYRFLPAPQRLTTTSVTVVTLPQVAVAAAALRYCFVGEHLPTLRERLRGAPFHGLVGNLGYYMTKALIEGQAPWAHNVRYPEFPLPAILSYVGFHLFRDETGEAYGSFQGAHPAAVGVRRDGRVDIIPRLEIEKYKVTLWDKELYVSSVNTPDAIDDVMLFTPGLRTPETSKHVDDWETYAPEIPIPGRVNVFIANEGNGRVPIERVVQIWEGQSPLPSFGAVLSFERGYFGQLFAPGETFAHANQRVKVEPLGNTNFDDYLQILGGLVPAIVEGRHIYCVATVDQLRERLRDYGNATSPIAQCGRETQNFAPRVREPTGVLLQTKERIGWVLFDGRHELSIGASVVDAAKILKLLEDDGAFGGQIRQAVFIDGGSAMKVYGVVSEGERVDLHLLNRVASGSRNGPGADGEGLNLYSVLRVGITTANGDKNEFAPP